MKRRDQIRMTEREVADYLRAGRTLAIATISPDGAPHVVAMWYALTDAGQIALWMYTKSQKALNLRRDPNCPMCGDHPTIHELIDYEEFCSLRH